MRKKLPPAHTQRTAAPRACPALRRAPLPRPEAGLRSEAAAEGGHPLPAAWILPFREGPGEPRGCLCPQTPCSRPQQRTSTGNAGSAGDARPHSAAVPGPLAAGSGPRADADPALTRLPGAPHAPLPPAPPSVSPGPGPSNYAAHESFFNVWFNTYRFFKQ